MAICLLACAVGSACAQADKLSKDERELIEKQVEKYCGFMQLFSGDMEQIDKMDSIFAMCENSKVQTFDDLSDIKAGGDAEYNSYPLFQYLQNITTKFDNSLQVEYSGFKCEKVVAEPKMNTTGLEGGNMPMDLPLSNTYALVHVVKRIKGKGIDKTVPLRITVNLSSLKIGGTVSEEYEDPYSNFLEGMELLQNGNEKKGLELLEKSSNYKTYPGRFRALTVMGIHYVQKQNWPKAISYLQSASEQDPVGGIYLAIVYFGNQAFKVPQQFVKPTVALQLLERYATTEDKDYPETTIMANVYLAGIYAQGAIVPQDLDKADKYATQAASLIEKANNKNFNSLLAVMPFLLKYSIAALREDLAEMKTNCLILENISNSAILTYDINNDYLTQVKFCAYSGLAGIYKEEKNTAKYEEYFNKVKTLNTPESNNFIANVCIEEKKYDEAIKYKKMAADGGNADAAYIMSLYYQPSDGIDLSQVTNEFDRYLYSPRPGKSAELCLKYAKVAAEQGHADAINRTMLLCFDGQQIGLPQDLEEGAKWCCKLGNTSAYSHYLMVRNAFNWVWHIYDKNKAILPIFERLAAQGDPVANYVCYQIFCYSEGAERDTVKGFDYLRKGAESGFHLALFDIAASYSSGMNTTKDYEQMLYWAKQLVAHNFPMGYVLMAEYETEVNKDYKKEMELYLKAFEMKEPAAAFAIGDIYYRGDHGRQKSLEKARYYFIQAIELEKALPSMTGNNILADAKQMIEKIDKEMGGQSPSAQPTAPTTYLSELDAVSDPSVSPEERIANSEKLLAKLFSSPNAVVKTVGSNGTTIVSTETASDFLMRLSTAPAKTRLVRIDSKTDAQGKFTELTVKEER